MLSEIIFGALSMIAPASCLVCDRRSTNGILCRRCLPTNKPKRDTETFYLWSYDSKAAKIITQAKYKPSAALCIKLGELLGVALTDNWFPHLPDLIIPIPPSPNHLKMRGFSHTGLIATGVAKLTKLGISHSTLAYTGTSVPQVGLSNKERIENMKGAFRSNAKLVKNKSILLIDDVVTTGATISAAKQALIEAGASTVAVATLAKVES